MNATFISPFSNAFGTATDKTDADGGANKLGTGIDTVDADANRGTDAGI